MAQFRSERGFALPITIFLITILTVMLATALARAGSDHEVSDSGQSVVDALAIAESGLHTYMDSVPSRPSDGDSLRFNITGGYADVVVLVLQNPPDQTENEYFVIRSTGYVINPNQGATPIAQRTVAQMALWQVGRINRIAAIVAANGITTSDEADIVVEGIDQCGVTAVAGVRLATQDAPEGDYKGSPPTWIGETADSVANETQINWQLISDGEFSYDYTDLSSMTDSSSYYIDGDLTLTTVEGKGLLIVTGDLTTGGLFQKWFGIVLVGGRIIFGVDDQEFRGIVVTGLNEQIAGMPPVLKNKMNKKDRDYKFYYASCNVEDALKALTGLIPINNAWIDNWATY